MNGIAVANPSVPLAVSVVPAHSSAVALFTTRATWLVASVGSTTTVASSAPPNPVSVYVTPASLNVIGLNIAGGPPPPNATSSK